MKITKGKAIAAAAAVGAAVVLNLEEVNRYQGVFEGTDIEAAEGVPNFVVLRVNGKNERFIGPAEGFDKNMEYIVDVKEHPWISIFDRDLIRQEVDGQLVPPTQTGRYIENGRYKFIDSIVSDNRATVFTKEGFRDYDVNTGEILKDMTVDTVEVTVPDMNERATWTKIRAYHSDKQWKASEEFRKSDDIMLLRTLELASKSNQRTPVDNGYRMTTTNRYNQDNGGIIDDSDMGPTDSEAIWGAGMDEATVDELIREMQLDTDLGLDGGPTDKRFSEMIDSGRNESTPLYILKNEFKFKMVDPEGSDPTKINPSINLDNLFKDKFFKNELFKHQGYHITDGTVDPIYRPRVIKK